MKAYITGATGCIGRNLVDKLEESEIITDIIVLHRKSSNLKKLEGCNVRFLEVDLKDYESLKEKIQEQADVIFHLAANVSHNPNQHRDQEKDNILVTENLVRLCIENKVAKRFIYCSTGATAICDNMSIDQIEKVRSGYIRTKKKSELVVQKGLKNKSFDAVILRPIITVGKYDYNNYSNIFELINNNKMMFSFPGELNFCHAEDVAEAHIAAFLNGKRGTIYYLTGEYTSWHDFCCRVAYKLGRRRPFKPLPRFFYYVISYIQLLKQKIFGIKALITPELIDLISQETHDVSEVEKIISRNDLIKNSKTLDKAIDDCYNWMKQERRI